MNDAIPNHLYSVQYTSFDQAVRVLEQDADLAKCHINSAFCLLLVHPADFEPLGFAFEGSSMQIGFSLWVA